MDPLIPADIAARYVPARPCEQGPASANPDLPRHPRPAGVSLNLTPTYAADYDVRDADGRMAPLDLRPFLDAMAARYDNCEPCFGHHTDQAASDSALTTHIIGTALSVFEIAAAPADTLLRKLDPPGAAIAVTIRGEGLQAAVRVATWLGQERRLEAVRCAAAALIPLGWFDSPVSNLAPVQRLSPKLGDEGLIRDLRTDGYLP